MKAIAMYLPQFHQVKENDEWWGEGYTEWTAVKSATPLFDGHMQPDEPLHDNYYNLLEKETMQWQAKLAKEYHVHGFCFYHYYFENGRKILEKPMENLLKWKDIDINYCMCWANETWARTWSKISSSNMWNEKLEKEQLENDENGILLQQRYGREEDWREHFEYMLPFFKDRRYIQKEGKPIFLIYRPELIRDLDGMMDYWNVLAKQSGLPGVYSIVMNGNEKEWDFVDAYLVHEPQNTSTEFRRNENIKYQGSICGFPYEDVWKQIVYRKKIKGKCVYQGAFIDYDDTPRRGTKGSLMVGSDIQIFKEYLGKLKGKLEASGLDFLFINAWNEWGEGMYLEPDKRNGYAALEAVSEVMTDNTICNDLHIEEVEEEIPILDSTKERYKWFNQWIFLREEGINIAEYLVKYKYRTIAIYGYGYLGKHFIYDMKQTELELQYIIDQQASTITSDYMIVDLEEELPIVDVIVITPFVAYREIRRMLRKKIDYPIISLKELIVESKTD